MPNTRNRAEDIKNGVFAAEDDRRDLHTSDRRSTVPAVRLPTVDLIVLAAAVGRLLNRAAYVEKFSPDTTDDLRTIAAQVNDIVQRANVPPATA